jgi:hypothetical protein
MKRLLALTLAVLATPSFAKEARTTIAVSCIVVSSGASVRMASITTTRACGPNCFLRIVQY